MKCSTIIFDNSFYEYFEKYDESDDGVVVFESKKKLIPIVYLNGISVGILYDSVITDYKAIYLRGDDSDISKLMVGVENKDDLLKVFIRYIDNHPYLCIDTVVNVETTKYTM